jgi:hypothetical protein
MKMLHTHRKMLIFFVCHWQNKLYHYFGTKWKMLETDVTYYEEDYYM